MPTQLCFLLGLLLAVQPLELVAKVYRHRVNPNWAPDCSYFWYRNDLAEGQREYVLVDAEKGSRQLAFDHEALAKALNALDKGQVQAERINVDRLGFDLSNDLAFFRYRGKPYSFHRQTHALFKLDALPTPVAPKARTEAKQPTQKPRYRVSRNTSPDGKWRAFVENHNLFVRPAKGEGETIQLTSDGSEEQRYQSPYWSPNSNNLIAFRTTKGEIGEVHLLESSPKEGGRAKLHSRRYALPGDPFNTHELSWFDLAARSQSKPEIGLIDFRGPHLRWSSDGQFARFEKIDRGHQHLRVIEIDMLSGDIRNIIDEQTDTFIWTEHANWGTPPVTWLKATDEIIYHSEKDGWRQLYLVDLKSRSMHPITSGKWVLRRVDKIDEATRQIWFRASGYYPDQDPYLMHYFRVNFDGSGLTALTDGNGDHEIHFSPDGRFIIDSYSRVDLPPVHELRRVSDGKLLCTLEEADVSQLKASPDWAPTEVFVAKGRDGKTDIWGIISRPIDFDPSKKYPVLEPIYAGPHSAYVPKRWSNNPRNRSWTDMGFVVANIDGMGTAHRSKAFHDVCWQNLKDAGLPDRIAWHKAVAAKYPWYDISRVGIFGGSAGGQNAAAALLFHPDFYKVGVASCGCHDNRMDKSSWNEQWMGYPVGPQYAASSNIDNAHRLKGKLMLILGEMDNNVPPESTLRFVDALIKAGKDFEFVLVPGQGHGDGGRYGDRRRRDFFRQHLLGISPPDRNAE